MIFNTHYPYIGGGGGKLNFEYTGEYLEVSDSKGWRIKFLTSGTLKLKSKAIVDVFLVGGGGGAYASSGGGGGGGYTKTVSKLELETGSYQITVGAGGAGIDGGATIAFNQTVNGGKTGSQFTSGNGGSGGGSYSANAIAPFYPAGKGGSDGSNGEGTASNPGGVGQGSTTREFGESDGELYAGGGGGSYASGSGIGAAGGGGGGGAGRNQGVPGESGTPNTGGGAGAGCGASGTGGSGVVVVRIAR